MVALDIPRIPLPGQGNEQFEKQIEKVTMKAEAAHRVAVEAEKRLVALEDKTDQFRQLHQSAQRRLTIAAMQQEIEELKRKSVFVPVQVEIQSLSSFGLNLKKPIPISIRREQDEYVASWLGGGLSSSGDTVEFAFEEVRSMIADSFKDMRSMPAGTKLGLAIARKFSTWVEFIA